ncbi:MAG: hypothetical protein ACO1TE_07385 [Prosthecobacter sp.]
MGQQSNGKTVFVGHMQSADGAMVMRSGLDGMLDATFGSNGYVGIPNWNRLIGMAVQGDDKIVLVGSDPDRSVFLVARVNANGQMDTSFGEGGMVSVPFDYSDAWASSVKIQADGKIVVGGSSGGGFAMARLHTDGSLDGSFGQGGKTVIPLGGEWGECLCLALREGGKIVAGGVISSGGQQDFTLLGFLDNGDLDLAFGVWDQIISPWSSGVDKCTAIAVRTDGKIIAVGQAVSSTGINECVVARYTSDGELDASFASGGRILFPLAASGGEANAVCLGVGGKIIVAGQGQEGGRRDFAVARLTEGGALDSSFRGGWVSSSLGGNNSASDAVVQSDGKILVCGQTGFGSSGAMTVARYTQAGELDQSFGTLGWARVNVAGSFSTYASRIVLQPDGKVVGIGNSTLEEYWVMARFLADGTLDSTFGAGGKVITSIGTGKQGAYDVALQPDGKMVVVGSAQPGADYDFAVARYLPDGSLDASFGAAGKVITTLSSGEDAARAVALQPDGKILVGGWATNTTGSIDFAVVRYLPDGALDLGFGVEGRALTAVRQWDDKAYDMKLQSDGKIILAGNSAEGAGLGALTCSAVVRHLPDGTLDASFGSGGKVVTLFNNDRCATYGVALQADGRIVTVGWAVENMYHMRGAGFVRYNEDGSLDTSFGVGGATHLAIGSRTSSATVTGVTIRDDGSLLCVGNIRNSYELNEAEWLVARYKAGPLLPMLGGGAALNISTSSTSVNATVRPNGSVTTAHLEYGPTGAYGSVASIALSPADGIATQSVNVGLSGLTPGTTYHYRLTASNAAGTRSTTSSTFTTLTLHQGWRQQHFGTSANTGNAADAFDFDGDGLPNLLEWATALNPTAASRLAHATRLEGGELEFNYARSVAAVSAGTLFSVEWSESLLSTSWSTAGVIQTVLSDDGVTQQVKAVLPAGETGRRFVRLRVE